MKIKLDPGAIMPERAHPDDAGLDLFTPKRFVLHPNSFSTVDTGVHIAVPKGCVGLVTSKSGLMSNGITCRGTIDSGYTGSIRAVLYNHTGKTHVFEAGEKITQIVILPIKTPELELVEELEETERADKGFGSSGKYQN